MSVIVVPHDRGWTQRFEREGQTIRTALAATVVAIHHIGSTSIARIYAKPIIDILVEATSLEDVDEKASALASAGYESMGEFGLPGRRYFRKSNSAGVREFHVHTYKANSAEAHRHLAFRDYLKSHPAVAEQYSRLKRDLVKRHSSDKDAYVRGKSPFIDAVERAALAWRRSAQKD